MYLRIQHNDGTILVSLLSSKTRVAPLKKLTIPRLEICGARLLAHLINHIQSVDHTNTFNWTDSTIVLSWIAGEPSRLKSYVGSRVIDIFELTGHDRWRHVRTHENPADCASRGLFPSELAEHDLWWHGPQWLSLDTSSRVPEEEKVNCLVHVVAEEQEPLIPVDRYSSCTHLKRVTAWILRFVNNVRSRVKGQSTCSRQCLLVDELQAAEIFCFAFIQVHHFSKEIDDIKAGRKIRRSSSILSLHPFSDDQGLLRIGGREQ